MRKMQKIAALGLAGTMALSLAACGGSGDSTADTASTAESTASSTEATAERDRKSTRLNSSHYQQSRMPSSA